MDYHEDLLFTDLDAFNQTLAEWLVFYNTERLHHSLGLQSPIQSLLINHPECHMLWTHTAINIYVSYTIFSLLTFENIQEND